MFTLEQIKTAHAKVKSGADFPAYIQALIKLGIASYRTYVTDGHTAYTGTDGQKEISESKYAHLTINNTSNSNAFIAALKNHQQGGSGYHSFCKDCAT